MKDKSGGEMIMKKKKKAKGTKRYIRKQEIKVDDYIE